MESDYITIKKAAEEFGITEASIRAKIYRRQWRSGVEFERAPDGRIYMIRSALHRWIKSELRVGNDADGADHRAD